ncbi:ABC transporter ATP-binding protein [Bacillus salipaludis]|uniref:ABC transporter ATP-binding protein n=1 Tax=Bacillus salipaludis TaxID=2547811 RepID=A0A4R5VNZ6_9BACI|nr:ABC transporter ATP-binding protein [Bacillus salipaludis]MDQ6596103.1 ABC transporter ATP-binding protein [Bacillus salipaludis]TDK59126.1 ABC transporter ATP-binding protein [Bacillus salipaludis]
MKLKINNLSKVFGDKRAVDGVSAELTNGVYGFLGANGSGKTTLMRMLATVSRPTSGTITFNGEDITKMGDRYRDVLGYLPQHIGYYRNFTVEKFLYYIASLKGIEKNEAQQRVAELLEIVNLHDKRKVKMGKLSGGMKQRVGIAQALLNDPKILIVDEPTAGLDPKERIRFRNLLAKIANDRIVLLSTHIVSDIEYIAKEILIMKNGQLIKKETPRNLLGQIQNIVWSVPAEEAEIPSFQESFKVGNIARKPEGIELRIISEEKPADVAVNVPVNLEDLYLYYFDEGVGA